MAAKELVVKPITLDEKLAESLELGVKNVLGKFFGIATDFKTPVRGQNLACTADLSGVISIYQEDIQGILTLGFPREMVFGMMAKIYRKDFSSIEQPIIDGVGEITNSVYGQVKRDMNERGFNLQLALPRVVVGRGHTVMQSPNRPTLLLPVSSDLGDFYASIILEHS